jgi:hypothetical protein
MHEELVGGMGPSQTRQNLGRASVEEGEDCVRAREPMGEGRISAVSFPLFPLHVQATPVFPPPSGQAVVCTSPMCSLALVQSSPSSHWSGQGSTLFDWFPYLKTIPCVWLTYCPDDGGSKHVWNVSKLLPDYTAQQPRRQSSSCSSLWEPQVSLHFCHCSSVEKGSLTENKLWNI